MSDDFEDLNALFKEVRRATFAAKPQAKSKQAAPVANTPPRQLYLDPANWTRVTGVALIHAESQTLLGNFIEWQHRTQPDVRKLVRTEEIVAVTRTESVSGDWWLGVERRPEPKQSSHEKRTVFVHLHLRDLGVHSPACEVIACLVYGGIARVELAIDTMCAQEDGSPEQLLMLPAGTNVLEVMTLDCKLALRKELGI